STSITFMADRLSEFINTLPDPVDQQDTPAGDGAPDALAAFVQGLPAPEPMMQDGPRVQPGALPPELRDPLRPTLPPQLAPQVAATPPAAGAPPVSGGPIDPLTPPGMGPAWQSPFGRRADSDVVDDLATGMSAIQEGPLRDEPGHAALPGGLGIARPVQR